MVQREEQDLEGPQENGSQQQNAQSEDHIPESEDGVEVGELVAVLLIFAVIEVYFVEGADEEGAEEEGEEGEGVQGDDADHEGGQEGERVQEEEGQAEVFEVVFVLDRAAEEGVHVCAQEGRQAGHCEL